MPSFKERRLLIATGGLQVDETGTSFARIVSGSVSACVPIIEGHRIEAASMVITGMAAGGRVFFTGAQVTNASAASSFYVHSVYAVGTNAASVYICNSGSVDSDAACVMGWHYVAFVP